MFAERREILKCKKSVSSENLFYSEKVDDWIALEINLKVKINGKQLVGFACSPVDCKDLAIGFLYTEGIVSHLREIDHIIINKQTDTIEFIINNVQDKKLDKWNNERTMSSGCGQGVISNIEYRRKNLLRIEDDFNLNDFDVTKLFDHLISYSDWYNKTGCIHQVTLFINDSIIIREDIGRHNAVDKVIGAAMQCGINFHNSILYSSGRLSSDMILKAGKAYIPVVVSKTAPTSLAVDIANEYGITLIGFARGKRFNIYTHPERIKISFRENQLLNLKNSEKVFFNREKIFIQNKNIIQEAQ